MKLLTKFKENWLLIKPHLDSNKDVQKRLITALFVSLFSNIALLVLVFGGAYYFLGHVPSVTVQVIIYLYIVYLVLSSSFESTVLYIEKKK